MFQANIIEQKIGYSFKDKNLLKKVFIHRSFINENKDADLEHNERLEFLGDAVLELAVTEHLFNEFADKNEGDLTSIRSALVKGETLAQIASSFELGKYLFLSKGEEKNQGRTNNFILANTLEALIGAIYLDAGFKSSKKFVDHYIIPEIERILEEGTDRDPKSYFQEMIQDKVGVTPHYEVISEEGPDHNKKFEVAVYIAKEEIARGVGSSKQLAQVDAAKNALKKY